mgnify:CR=1 FL=1
MIEEILKATEVLKNGGVLLYATDTIWGIGCDASNPEAVKKVYAIKPLTFMNNSGRSVRAAMNFYKIPLDNVIVFHDELDLPFGEVRVKKGGSDAGHNGLKSIDENIGKDYYRVRIGISHPGDKDKVTNHVLGDLSKEDNEALDKILSSIAKNISILIDGDEKKFQKNITPSKK